MVGCVKDPLDRGGRQPYSSQSRKSEDLRHRGSVSAELAIMAHALKRTGIENFRRQIQGTPGDRISLWCRQTLLQRNSCAFLLDEFLTRCEHGRSMLHRPVVQGSQ